MNLSFPWWVYPLLSAFFAALTTVFAKLGVESVSSNLATAIRTVVIVVMAWGIVYFTGEVNGLSSVPRNAWLWLILSALATGASWLFYFRGLQLGPASWVAPLDKTSVAMVLVLSVLFLHEPLTWKSAVGTGLILGGTLVFVL